MNNRIFTTLFIFGLILYLSKFFLTDKLSNEIIFFLLDIPLFLSIALYYLNIKKIQEGFLTQIAILTKSLSDAKAEKYKVLSLVFSNLAHSMRKPYSSFECFLSLLDNDTKLRHQSLISELSDDLKKHLGNVNMTIDSTHQLRTVQNENYPIASIDPTALIIKSLNEVFRDETMKNNWGFEYSYSIDNYASANQSFMFKAITNTLRHVVSDLDGKNRIHFYFDQNEYSKTSTISIVVDISNTYLPTYIDDLFSLDTIGHSGVPIGINYTLYKMYLNKIGGDFSIQFNESNTISFLFALPLSDEKLKFVTKPVFPLSSGDIINQKINVEVSKSSLPDQVKAAHFRSFLIKNPDYKFNILMIEDISMYSDSVKKMIDEASFPKGSVNFTTCDNAKDAEYTALNNKFHLYLVDIDLRSSVDRLDGFKIIRNLKNKSCSGRYTIHSDRKMSQEVDNFICSGADHMMAKPIGLGQLIDELLATQNMTFDDIQPNPIETSTSSKSFKLIIVEDNIMTLRLWETLAVEQIQFRSPEEFFDAYSHDTHLIDSVDAFVIDFHYENPKSEFDGQGFAKKLKALGFKQKLFLFSNKDVKNEDIQTFDAVVSKRPPEALNQIRSILEIDFLKKEA